MKTTQRRRRRKNYPVGADGTTILDRLYLARKLTQASPRLGEWTLTPFESPSLEEIVRLADELGVDARWLATGEASPAGAAAARLLVDSGFVADDEDVGVLTVRLTPQPPAPPNPLSSGAQCRYCGCVEECACDDGCAWVADGICSACLEGRTALEGQS